MDCEKSDFFRLVGDEFQSRPQDDVTVARDGEESRKMAPLRQIKLPASEELSNQPPVLLGGIARRI